MIDTANLTIGALAALCGVTPETIRYYEREGVIPRAKRSGSGAYRRYGRADAERLRFVRRARALGFGLDAIRGLLTLASSDPERECADADRIARGHLAQIDEKLSQLVAMRAELGRLIGSCDGASRVGDCTLLSALSAQGRGR